MRQAMKDMMVLSVMFVLCGALAGGIVFGVKAANERPELKSGGFFGMMAEMERSQNLHREMEKAESSSPVLIPAVIK